MNRTKRIQSILEKNILDFSINVIDNSLSHKGHNNFNGSGETHLIVELNKGTKTKINRLEVHKHIHTLLKQEFLMGLHSLQIKII